MLSSLSASASRVAVMDADTALYNFEIVFLKNAFIFYCIPWEIFFKFYGQRKWLRGFPLVIVASAGYFKVVIYQTKKRWT